MTGSDDADRRDEQFAEFAWDLTRATGLSETITQILATAQEMVGADGAGLTLLRAHGRLESAGQTSDRIARSDQLQHRFREGPCVEAALEVHNVMSVDLGADDRWPRWGPAAADLGLRSVLSASLHGTGRRRLGAVNLYGRSVGQFEPADLETARLFAAHAAAALWSAFEIHHLNAALDSRAHIGEAMGILMHRYDLTDDQAFRLLKRYSQDSNIKLRAVADDVIENRDLPGSRARTADHPAEEAAAGRDRTSEPSASRDGGHDTRQKP